MAVLGTAFTAPAAPPIDDPGSIEFVPAVTHGPFQALDRDPFADQTNPEPLSPNQLRWDPPPLPNVPTDFVEGLLPNSQKRFAGDSYRLRPSSMYVANRSMGKSVFLQRRWRASEVPQHGAFDPRYRARRMASRAAGDSRHSSWPPVPGRSPRAERAVTSAKISPRRSSSPDLSAPLDRMARRTA